MKLNSDSCPVSTEKLAQLLSVLIDIDGEPAEDQIMSKTTAADYMGVSRSTFDNYVKDGIYPKGHKYENLKELIWFKYELDLYKSKM